MVANQLPGLLPQVQSGRVQMVTVLIGDDDFGNFLQQAPALASDPQALMAKLTEVTATAEANFDGSVNAILGANPNVKVVVGTIFDITKTPAVEGPLAAFRRRGSNFCKRPARRSRRITRMCARSRRVMTGWRWRTWRRLMPR